MRPYTYTHPSITIHCIPSGPVATNAYVVSCNETKNACIIDPAANSKKQIQEIIASESLLPQFILLTHSHWDHIVDTSFLQKLYTIPVFVHPEDAGNVLKPGSDGLSLFVPVDPVEHVVPLHENELLTIGTSFWQVIHTPGHSPGSIVLFSKEQGLLLSGDTLFKGSIGRLDLPTSEPQRMWVSLKKLKNLPKNTVVFPGHGAKTTIGEESWLDHAEEYFS